MIGGDGPKRTMPLVARYADVWNCRKTLENFIEKSSLLDNLLSAEGRHPSDVKRTMMVRFLCGQTQAERDQIFAEIPEPMRHFFGTEDVFRQRFTENSPQELIEHLKAFEEAGCEEIIIQYYAMNGNTQLDILAEHILPHFNS